MIRHIVFDMGKVVINFDPCVFMDREGITDPEDRKLIMNELFRSVEWAQMDMGILTEESAEPSILTRFPDRLKEAVHHLLFSWFRPYDTVPGMEDLVTRLKSAGYGIWLLSNASRAQHQYWPKVRTSSLFDGTLISCDIGYIKPMHEIYECFCDRFGLAPEECLFVDDVPANVAGAIACGWQGIVFHGSSTELERKLQDMRISIMPADFR